MVIQWDLIEIIGNETNHLMWILWAKYCKVVSHSSVVFMRISKMVHFSSLSRVCDISIFLSNLIYSNLIISNQSIYRGANTKNRTCSHGCSDSEFTLVSRLLHLHKKRLGHDMFHRRMKINGWASGTILRKQCFPSQSRDACRLPRSPKYCRASYRLFPSNAYGT